MDQNLPITDLRALTRNVTASELSGSQAHEIWRAMQLIAKNGSLKGLPDSIIHRAMELNHFLNVWKIVTEKALAYERNTVKRKG